MIDERDTDADSADTSEDEVLADLPSDPLLELPNFDCKYRERSELRGGYGYYVSSVCRPEDFEDTLVLINGRPRRVRSATRADAVGMLVLFVPDAQEDSDASS